MDAYIIEWFKLHHANYLHVCNLTFSYIYLCIGILFLIRRLMLFCRNEQKRRLRLMRYKRSG